MTNKLVENPNIHYKSLKLRLYPTDSQSKLIIRTFGCTRLVYNERLQEKNEFYINNILPIPKENKKQRLEMYKTFKPRNLKIEFPFLSEVSSQALCQSENDLKKAFTNFFKSNNKTRKGKSNFPKYKSKKESRQSYRECMISQDCLDFPIKTIKLPKLGTVKISVDSLPNWYKNKIKICNITIENSPSGRYFAVLLCEIKGTKRKNPKCDDKTIGLDFSPEFCYVDSDGKKGKDFGYIPQKQMESKRLAKLSRRLNKKKIIALENSPRKIPSHNREKARIKLARLEEKISNRRKDWIEKETLRLVSTYGKVVVEDLNLVGISKFLPNAKNMTDTSWATFVARLEQKSEDWDCEVVKANRWYPSSQICNNCGYQYKKLILSDREWTCPNCGEHHDRDMNAARNLRGYLPQELREVRSVEGTEGLASLALEISGVSNETERDKVTSPKKMPSL